MKRILNLRNIVLSGLVTFGLILVVTWKFVEVRTQDRVQIINRVGSIRAESLKQVSQSEHLFHFEVTVRNISPQPIKAITLKIEDAQASQTSISTSNVNGLSNDWVLMPNETVRMLFDVPITGKVRAIFVAAMFDNGNTEGDNYFTEKLKNKKEGIKLAYQRILPILRRNSNLLTDDSTDEVFDGIINEIKSIDQASIPEQLKIGFLDGKNDLVSSINYLKGQRNNPQRNYPLKSKETYLTNLTRIERVLGRP